MNLAFNKTNGSFSTDELDKVLRVLKTFNLVPIKENPPTCKVTAEKTNNFDIAIIKPKINTIRPDCQDIEKNNCKSIKCCRKTKSNREVTATTPADKPFSTIRQGNATNTLTKLRATKDKGFTIDQITGNATIKNGNFMLTIPNYAQLTGLKTSTYQLLDAITVAFTESGAKSPTVILPLEEYMKRRGLKDRKEAKNQVKADLEVLRQASITGEEKRGKKTISYSFVNIADSGEVKRNGDIVFTYGNTFYQMLLGYPIMPYPAQLQTLNNKKNPNSYYLLRKIAEHKNMNISKKNEDIIAVKTLLGAASYLPSYEDVMAGDRAVNRKIITPFERDMDALRETLGWSYCHSKGEPLTDTELQALNYDFFLTLLVKIEWTYYPDQTARLEKKAERIEQTKKNRKRSRKTDPRTDTKS